MCWSPRQKALYEPNPAVQDIFVPPSLIAFSIVVNVGIDFVLA